MPGGGVLHSRYRSRAGIVVALAVSLGASVPVQANPVQRPPDYDRIESVQARAWPKRGAFSVAPLGSYAFNDPFLFRGGGGGRLTYWPRPIIGFTLEGSAFAQTPTPSARVAQRELRARMRPTASGWVAMLGGEVSALDGKIALGSSVLPFEGFLRLSAGAAASDEALDSSPALAFGGGVGMRWFVSSWFGLETTLAWRSASIRRDVSGRSVAARDTAVAFELALPIRIGGTR